MSIAFRPLMPMIDYALNYDKIINEICENRAEPELLCNGFCYVKKEVNKTEKNQTENRFVKSSVKVLDAVVPLKQFIKLNKTMNFDKVQLFYFYQDKISNQIKPAIFHPPIV